ncbi:hypothetical protein ACVCAH_06775 [Micromonospora sp. LZ34]
MRTARIATGLGLVIALAGCGGPGSSADRAAAGSAPASTATGTPAGASPPAPPSAGPPRLCAAPAPAQRRDFPYDRDSERRDSLIGIDPADPYTGGIASFGDLDAADLAALIEARFADPYERQNAAPTVWQIFRFLCEHPQVRAAGYVVSPDRPDYRTSLESIYAPRIDADLRAAAERFCVDAEAVTLDGGLECFWD